MEGMFPTVIRWLPTICATIGLILPDVGTASLWAADASQWAGDSRSGARLIAGRTVGDANALRAGVEIRLAQGWKTYWRYPGDSGVPPQFDFSASENVKSVTVSYPAPQRFDDSDGITIGYKYNVVFPLHIEPQQPDKPVALRLKLDYAVCEKICIPAEAKAELTLASGASANDASLTAAERRVPKKIAPGADAPLSIKAAKRGGTENRRVLVDVSAPSGAKVALFAEGPTAHWALPIPEPVTGAGPGLQRFAFLLDGLPTGTSDKGVDLTFTAVTEADAIETTLRLD
jgi:DsbC/DsbD-like thiol-disulfide interchange protein